jgi:PadR family transcriptional regulator PadR
VKSPRSSPETLILLREFSGKPSEWRYGYELSRATGLNSGTLYPILMRLEKLAFLEAKWVTTQPGIPPRHTFRLTPNGREYARNKLADLPRVTARQPAFRTG